MGRASDEQIAQLTPIIEKLRAEKDLPAFCVLITDYFQKIYELSDNSLMYLLYHPTVIPQRRLYAQYIQANGLDTTLHYLNSIYEGITSRDSERAKREMLAMLNIALEGPTAVV